MRRRLPGWSPLSASIQPGRFCYFCGADGVWEVCAGAAALASGAGPVSIHLRINPSDENFTLA